MCVLLTHRTCEHDCEASSSTWAAPGVWSRYATTEGASHLAFGLGAKLPFGDHQPGFPPAAASPKRAVKREQLEQESNWQSDLCCGAVSALFLLCHITLILTTEKSYLYRTALFLCPYFNSDTKAVLLKGFPIRKQQSWEQTLLPHPLLIKQNTDNYCSKFPLLWPLHLTTPPGMFSCLCKVVSESSLGKHR